MKVRQVATCLVFWLTTTANSMDYDQSFELTTAMTGSSFSGVDDIEPPDNGAGDSIDANLDLYWNLYLYPSDATQFNFRYGLSAQQNLYQTGINPMGIESETANYRLTDVSARILGNDDENYQLYQQLDQLALTWYSAYGDFVIGRQPISFGIAKVFSPVDVIQPQDLYATDASYRPGVDAIRGTWLLNAVSELDTGIVIGEDQAAFGRLKTNFNTVDYEFIGLTINGEQAILSLGTQSALGNVGVWQESALMFADGNAKLRSTLGVDITVLDDLYLMAEVHYNALGASEDYMANTRDNAFYQLGAVVPLGRWYSSVQASYPLNILTQLNVGATVNLNDGSVLTNTAISVNATDSLVIDASLVIPLATDHSLSREYGMHPSYVALEFGWVF